MTNLNTRRNTEAGTYIKTQKLSNNIRVIIEPWFDGRYRIAAQSFAPGYSYSWEKTGDGWHYTSARFSTTMEGAKRVFDEMVRDELRWLEQRA